MLICQSTPSSAERSCYPHTQFHLFVLLEMKQEKNAFFVYVISQLMLKQFCIIIIFLIIFFYNFKHERNKHQTAGIHIYTITCTAGTITVQRSLNNLHGWHADGDRSVPQALSHSFLYVMQLNFGLLSSATFSPLNPPTAFLILP